VSKNRPSTLYKAVLQGNLGAVQKAIEQGDDVDGLDPDGRTPLFHAIIDRNLAIASELIKRGANLHQTIRAIGSGSFETWN